jgi:hypothetical protein
MDGSWDEGREEAVLFCKKEPKNFFQFDGCYVMGLGGG